MKKGTVPTLFSFSKQEAPKSKRQLRYEARSVSTREIDQTHDVYFDRNEHIVPTSYQVCAPDIGCEIEVPEAIEEANLTVKMSVNTSQSDKCTQINIEHIYGSIGRFKDDDLAIKFYTGFESYQKFYLVYSTLSPLAAKITYFSHHVLNLSYEDQFFLTLMKLRQNKTILELSRFFCISSSTVSNIFITWVNFIHQMWNRLDIWPSRDLINFYMPESFKQYDKSVRVILDGTEFPIQKPGNTITQQSSWSTYKHSNTLKVLVGATPGGLLSFCSPAYGGSTSDRQTIERSNLLVKCESGDTILADRGFNVQDIFVSKNVKVNTPAFLKGKSQLPGLTVLHDRELASKRVHIERLIGLTKTYKILKSDLDHSYVPLATKIFYICFMCCNFREGIINQNIK